MFWGIGDNKVYAETESESSSIEDVLLFSLYNNGTEYRVKARDKNITKIKIPATYKDLPVTEIADSGFANCKSLVKIEFEGITDSITRIGNLAFSN